MIAIIADDFTGAAELAGISLRYGLKVELCIGEVEATHAEVLIVSTDSRSLPKDAALQKTEKIVQQVLQLNPEWIYKKIDSVLRGYVVEELKVQMLLMNKNNSFILSANPSLGRTIHNGNYFVHGLPINETGFANDPEFPIQHAAISSMLKDESIKVIKHHDDVNAHGILIGEAVTDSDIIRWTAFNHQDYVLAGAGDFFTALLHKQFHQKKQDTFNFQRPLLYVCGTAFEPRIHYIHQVDQQDETVVYISNFMIEQESVEALWLQQVKEILDTKQRAIIAFKQELIPEGMMAATLRIIMAKAIQALVIQNGIRELFIEGGSTATAILQALNISNLMPVNEMMRGVVRMLAAHVFITVKPGSYELPIEIKKIFGG